MMRLIVFVLLVVSTPLLAQSDPQEIACWYTAKADDGTYHRVQAENLEVLAQVESTGKFVLPKDAPASVIAINCLRTSPVPVLQDRAVPDAGLHLYIAVQRSSAPTLVALSLVNDEYRLVVASGELNPREQARAAEVLAMMNTVRANESD